jgi:hypothetical protein
MAPNVEPKVEMADEECPHLPKGKCLKKAHEYKNKTPKPVSYSSTEKKFQIRIIAYFAPG